MTNHPSKLDKVLETLNLEEQQEDLVEAHRESFFDDLPPDEKLFERIREYDDLTKHLVRKESWLKVARKLHEKKGSSLRVLTLPGRHRLEVGLYLEEGVLECIEGQDGTLVVPVVGFETSPDVFGLLTAMKPRLERLFNGDLITALISSKAQNHRELRRLFPFDIVNLDLTVNLVTPSEGPYGPVLVAIREIFKLQAARTEDWSLMITFRAGLDATDPEAVQQLKRQYQDNIEKHSQVLDACFERYKVTTAEKLYVKSPEEALGQFTAKWLVDLAHTFDWGVASSNHVQYDRNPGSHRYSIRKLVFHFSKQSLPLHTIPNRNTTASWQIDDIVRVVKSCASINYKEKLEKLRTEKPQYIDNLMAEIERLKNLAEPIEASLSNDDVQLTHGD